MATEDKLGPLLPFSDVSVTSGGDVSQKQSDPYSTMKIQMSNSLESGKAGSVQGSSEKKSDGLLHSTLSPLGETEAVSLQPVLPGLAFFTGPLESSDGQPSRQELTRAAEFRRQQLIEIPRKWGSDAELRCSVEQATAWMVLTQERTLLKLVLLERAADPNFPYQTFEGTLYDAFEDDFNDFPSPPYVEDVVERFDFVKKAPIYPRDIPSTDDPTILLELKELYTKAKLATLQSKECQIPMFDEWSARVEMPEADREASRAGLSDFIKSSEQQCKEAHNEMQEVLNIYEDLKSKILNGSCDPDPDDGTEGCKDVEA